VALKFQNVVTQSKATKRTERKARSARPGDGEDMTFAFRTTDGTDGTDKALARQFAVGSLSIKRSGRE
jgi:ssDNA-binding replication factor A large subunit